MADLKWRAHGNYRCPTDEQDVATPVSVDNCDSKEEAHDQLYLVVSTKCPLDDGGILKESSIHYETYTPPPSPPPPPLWELLPGTAKDIGVGGNAWIIGTNPVPGGFGIWTWHGNDWIPWAGGAVRIDVSHSGVPWVVNDAGNIYREYGGAFHLLPGTATDIGVGGLGTGEDAWIIGTNPVPGGFGIWTWNSNGWTAVDGGGVRITVDNDGNPWIVNDAGNIYLRKDGAWHQLPGTAKDIGVGGGAWIIGTNPTPYGFGIWTWNGVTWIPDSGNGSGMQIAVSHYNNTPLVVNNAGNIYRRN